MKLLDTLMAKADLNSNFDFNDFKENVFKDLQPIKIKPTPPTDSGNKYDSDLPGNVFKFSTTTDDFDGMHGDYKIKNSAAHTKRSQAVENKNEHKLPSLKNSKSVGEFLMTKFGYGEDVRRDLKTVLEMLFPSKTKQFSLGEFEDFMKDNNFIF